MVLGDDVLRADYEQALADQAANGPVESFTDSQGCEWVSLSALRVEETTNRQGLLQLQEENRKVLENESAATDELVKKKDEQFQKKEQELDRALQELESLASQKRLDDVRVQYEGLQAERAAASQQAAAELALASHQVAAALAAQQINELKAALNTQEAERLKQVAALDKALKTHEAEDVKQLAERQRLKTQVAEYVKQVAARDVALKIHEAEHIKQLAARDKVLTIKEAEYLQKLAQQDDQFLRLTTQLQDLQRTQQHPDEDLWTAQEQVSRDQLSAAVSQLQPPPRPPPPPRCSTDGLNPPPSPDYSTQGDDHEHEQW